MSSQLQSTTHMFAAPARSQPWQAAMRELLGTALDHQAGDARAQRLTLDRINRDAGLANLPPIEWLKGEFFRMFQEEHGLPAPAQLPQGTNVPNRTAERLENVAVHAYQCEECGKGFATHHALCGHKKTHRR